MFRNGFDDTVIATWYIWIAPFSFSHAPFAPSRTITKRFQDLFTFGEEYFSAFSRLTFFAIGLRTCLGFGVDTPDLPAAYPSSSTFFPQSTFLFPYTGLSPSMVPLSSRLLLDKRSCTWVPHPPAFLQKFGLPSPAFTRRY